MQHPSEIPKSFVAKPDFPKPISSSTSFIRCPHCAEIIQAIISAPNPYRNPEMETRNNEPI